MGMTAVPERCAVRRHRRRGHPGADLHAGYPVGVHCRRDLHGGEPADAAVEKQVLHQLICDFANN